MILLERDIIHSSEEIIQRSTFLISDVGAARKVFPPHWSQNTITHHCFHYFPLFHG